jgi:hypothetical protein
MEEVKKPVGYLKIETVKVATDEVVETYEHHNMIMDGARTTIMNSIGGFESKHINKFIMATEGNKTGDLTTAKNASDGFIATRTQLFGEESGTQTYSINFEPTVVNAPADVTEDDELGGSLVTINQSGTMMSYVIEVGADAANNGSQVGYTECALYTGDTIFAMRCFPVRIKDASTKFRITWSISF